MSPRPLIALVLSVCAGAACSKSSAQQPPAGGSNEAQGEGQTVKPAPPAPVSPGPREARSVVVDDGAVTPGDHDGDGDADGPSKRGYRERMKQFDTNGDGTLSDDERYAMLKSRAADVLGRMDTDGDGQLSRAEFDAAPGARRVGDFAAADLDHSGALSPDELGTAMIEQMKKAGGFRAWRGMKGAGPGSGSGGSE